MTQPAPRPRARRDTMRAGGHRRRRSLRLGTLAVLGSFGIAATAAASTSTSLRDGDYGGIALKRFPTADVEFHVTDHGTRIPRLRLYCVSHIVRFDGGAPGGEISLTAPPLRIRSGRVSYRVNAAVRPPSTFTIAAYAPLRIAIHHVNGPVVHYTVGHTRRSLPTAWKGTVSSPACTTIGARGRVLLFGPVPGA